MRTRRYDDPEILGPEPERAGRVRAGFWRTLKRAARRIPFAEDVVAAYYCAFDPATPRGVRVGLLAALAYFVTPTDLVPDVLAAVGFTDDAAVLAAAIALVRGHITERHRAAARAAVAETTA
jgi:uncharacterized membrane protein YkvA (DUF1232 family)